MTLVDTNVLLDVITGDERWFAWSIAQLERASLAGPLFINDVVYAELAARYEHIDDLDVALWDVRIEVAATPRPALFLAGRAYLAYRRAGGTRTGVLPDFFIGAHAAVLGTPLITRDTRRYRTYFPTVELITPPA
ncbi:MAG TPA: type II toxin-antitoxin system VapC family toxin [Devosia sp.]